MVLTAASTVVLFMLPAGHDAWRGQPLTPMPPSGWRNVPVIPRDGPGEEHVARRVVGRGERDLQRRAGPQLGLPARTRAERLVVEAERGGAAQVGADRAAGSDAVHSDVGRELVGEGDDEAADGELAADVQHAAAAGVEARRRARQHDAAAGLGERTERGVDAEQHRRHVDVEQLVERRQQVVAVEVTDAAVEVEDADAVDEDVEAAVGIDGRGDGGLVVVRRRRVPGDDDRGRVRRARSAALAGSRSRATTHRAVGDEGVVDGSADARSGADHQRPLARQPVIASSSSGPNGSARKPVNRSWDCHVRLSSSSGSRSIERPSRATRCAAARRCGSRPASR